MTPARSILWRSMALILLAGAVGVAIGGCAMFNMPGTSHSGPLPPLTDEQRRLADAFRRDVVMLAETIGERNIWRPEAYEAAAAYIHAEFTAAGFTVSRQSFIAQGVACHNIEAQRIGVTRPDEIVILGAHYDSLRGTVGANDNASGVAAILAIARALHQHAPQRTLRFVAFANEEPPFFRTDEMGSLAYAARCRQRGENIVAMISFDGVGCYSDEPHSQMYPPPLNLLYPRTGNFIGFVANVQSVDLVRRVTGLFRRHAAFPSEGGAAPDAIEGVGWSDHWAFWQHGYPAILVTDSLPFRYTHYHTTDDTADKIDYDRAARVVAGITAVTDALTKIEDDP